jgi:hypothetical protein
MSPCDVSEFGIFIFRLHNISTYILPNS